VADPTAEVEMADESAFGARPDEVLVGGIERREITIEEYDPAWVERFESERAGSWACSTRTS
jgi:hypothetical protein